MNDNKRNLFDYLPGYYRELLESREVISMEEREFEKLFDSMDDVLAQFFVDTATWGLSRWEKSFGLPYDNRLSIEERRIQVISRMRSISPITLADFINYLDSYAPNGGSTVREYPSEYRIVAVIHAGGSLRLHEIEAALNEVLPAHLAWSFEVASKNEISIKFRVKRHAYNLIFPGDLLTGTFPYIYAEGLIDRKGLHVETDEQRVPFEYPFPRITDTGTYPEPYAEGLYKPKSFEVDSDNEVYSTEYPKVATIAAGGEGHTDFYRLGQTVVSSLGVAAEKLDGEITYPIVAEIMAGGETETFMLYEERKSSIEIEGDKEESNIDYPITSEVMMGESPNIANEGMSVKSKIETESTKGNSNVEYPYVNDIKVGEDV